MGEPISKRRVLDPAHRPSCRRAGHRQAAALLCLLALAAPAACSPQTDAAPAPDAGPVNHCTMHVVGDHDSGLGTLDYQEDGYESGSHIALATDLPQVPALSSIVCDDHADGGLVHARLFVSVPTPITAPLTVSRDTFNYQTFSYLVQLADRTYWCIGRIYPDAGASVMGEYSMTLISVTRTDDAGPSEAEPYPNMYVIHGTAHGVCPPGEEGHENTGYITFDVTF